MCSFKPSNLPCITQNSYVIPQCCLIVLDLEQHLHYFTLAG
ncbi:hypothetical protein BT93_F2392 [Corymbia citriodora subsp. variegata]|nr:hypothetical protein BT93_F2392 [Corymbia citriodora subsp. variegata]